MPRDAVTEVGRPRQTGRGPVAAAVEETTPASDGEGQCERYRERVTGLGADAERRFRQLDRDIRPDEAGGHGFAVSEPGGRLAGEAEHERQFRPKGAADECRQGKDELVSRRDVRLWETTAGQQEDGQRQE